MRSVTSTVHSLSLSALLAIVLLVPASQADFPPTWCGKYYDPSKMSIANAPPPGGAFSVPATSQNPLLAFGCAPAIRPYLAEDASSSAAILIDSPIVHSNILGAEPISLPSGSITNAGSLSVIVSVDGKQLAKGSVPLNASAYEMSFSLKDLTPQATPYNLSCQATYSPSSGSQTFSTSGNLYFLPDPTTGGVTKIDQRTGAMLAKPANGQGSYQPIFPFGFFSEFEYLAGNLSLIDELAEQGFTTMHPIFESTPSQSSVNEVLGRMVQNNMYFMYDMRYVYQEAANVTEQVNQFKTWSNLLVWYTADEPDGWSDPQNGTSNAYDLIYNLDGYHPVSLVLNCQDYYFTTYAAGADIIMDDVYIIGANVNTSLQFNTPCTENYGDCGCDNCQPIPAGLNDALPPGNASSTPVPANSGIGSFTDVTNRVTSYFDRMRAVGWGRTKTVWSVPQAFGGPGDNYWVRPPTGQEWVVTTLLGINHGSLGAISWSYPTTSDIQSNATALALALPKLTPFFFDPAAVRSNYMLGGVDVATWRSSNQTLIVATNTYYVSQPVNWNDTGLNGKGASQVFVSGSGPGSTSNGFTLDAMSSVAYVLPSSSSLSSSSSGSSSNTSNGSSTSGAQRSAHGGSVVPTVMTMAMAFASLLLVS